MLYVVKVKEHPCFQLFKKMCSLTWIHLESKLGFLTVHEVNKLPQSSIKRLDTFNSYIKCRVSGCIIEVDANHLAFII